MSGLTPRLGVFTELAARHDSTALLAAQLSRWVACGWCTPAKSAALQAWPGTQTDPPVPDMQLRRHVVMERSAVPH